MINLMQEITCSDIRISELKLKRIKLCKDRLLQTKPSPLKRQKLKEWQAKLDNLNDEEKDVEKELRKAYIDLERFYN